MPKDIILVDLDGTIALIEHRLHHVRKKTQDEHVDWDAFFAACKDDSPNLPIIKIVRRLSDDMRIHIVSGRSDAVRAETIQWLKKNNVPFDNLIMRKAGDYTADDVLKERWLNDATIDADRVLCVFDDCQRVVDMWRRHGLTCLQVAHGEF